MLRLPLEATRWPDAKEAASWFKACPNFDLGASTHNGIPRLML
jgi:hypothetical protein